MAKIAKFMRQYADTKLSEAAEIIKAARQSVPTGHMNLDRALHVIDECRAAVEMAEDIDTAATHLRAASRALGHFCSGPATACVSSAIKLIDQAIGGETYG